MINFISPEISRSTIFWRSQWKSKLIRSNSLNSFVPNALFLYPLKTENLTIFWCFHGVEKGCIGNKWFNARRTQNLDTISCPTFCTVLVFPPLGHFRILLSVWIEFSICWNRYVFFNRTVFDFYCGDWNGFCSHIGNIFWEDISDLVMPHRKYQVNTYLSQWFPAAYVTVIACRNHFFCSVPTE